MSTDGAHGADPAVVMAFKVSGPDEGVTLVDAVIRAREKIGGKACVADLVARGIAEERIHTLGIEFRGKEVLVG